MDAELRNDLKNLKSNSIYAVLGTHWIAFIVIIGRMQGYTYTELTLGVIAILYILLMSYYYFKILQLANKHLDDE